MSPTETDLQAVQARLDELRARKRVRWQMSARTAELAIAALRDERRPPHRPGGKSRRRKRRKRLL